MKKNEEEKHREGGGKRTGRGREERGYERDASNRLKERKKDQEPDV